MVTVRALAVAVLAAAAGIACRGTPPGSQSAAGLVDSLVPAVERAAGMRFRTPPRVAMRSRAQVRAYLSAKLDDELPAARAAGMETAYQLFGLLPDSVHLRPLLLDLLSEQVIGYYDADSAMLFGVAGSPRDQLRLVMAHEMVHALQGQYLPLDSIFHDLRSNDRLTAAQAVLEGQATVASIGIYSPDTGRTAGDDFWSLYGDQVREQQAAMPVFSRAPLVVREGLIFPYVAGAEFMHWWATASGHADTLPYGPRMPASTEQVLHPDRYARGDAPLDVVIDTGGIVLHEDVLGEMETRVLLAVSRGSNRPDELPAVGWGGDRYRVITTPEGPALVWYIVFDDEASADRFVRLAAGGLGRASRPGYRASLDRVTVGGKPAVRHVVAPASWTGWSRVPAASLREPGPYSPTSFPSQNAPNPKTPPST
jgi:hypothetical protein